MFKIRNFWVPQYGGSWSDLSVFDNLMAIAELNIKKKEERLPKINNLIRKFQLENVIKLKSNFSPEVRSGS